MERRAVATWAAVALLSFASPAAGDQKPPKAPVSDNYEVLYARYLEAARTMTAAPVAAPAAAPAFGWMSNLGLDPRARNVNDLVTVRVVETITGVGSADSSLDKNSKAKAGVAQVFGAENYLPSWLDAANLVGAASDTQFKGGGTTTRSSELTATMTARVVEVLPNGDLVLEGAREIEINGDRQIVVLTGVVRPSDIGRNNVVLSPAVGQLRIRYFGRGLIKDNLRPGWLVRVLNMIF
jgi:flagellar L-ring protein precursor FlgH